MELQQGVGGLSSGDTVTVGDGVSPSIKMTVFDYTNSNPAAVRLTDTNGDYVSAGGGTQYTDGAASPANPVGTIPVFNDGGTIRAVSAANPLPVSGSFTPPALQDVNLTQVGGAAFALGQQLATASIPVVLTAAQISTLTPQTNALTDAQLRASPVPVSLTSTTITGTVAVTQSGAWTVTANAGTDLNTSALLTTAAFNAAFGTAGTPDAQVLSVQGITSMTPLLVDGSGSTQPISGTVTVTQGTAANLNATVVGTGTFAVQAAQSGTWNITNISGTVSLPTGAATETTLAAINAKLVSGTDIGDVTVNNASGASAVNIQDGGNSITVDAPLGTPVFATLTPNTTGGWSVGNYTTGDTYTALTNSAQVIKGSAGTFGGYYIYNPNSSAMYVMVYNVAAASVTVGTTTPQLVFCIPATAGANLEIANGINFSTAMSIAAATTGGGNTAPGTALEAMVWYK